MAAAEQQQKRAAALEYNFEDDGRWADYWNNVLVPAHLSSNLEVLRHYKLKFYQRYIDPELQVEPLKSVTPPTSAPSPSVSQPAAQHGRPVNAGTRSSNGSSARAARPDSAAVNPSKQHTFQFLNNAWVLIMAVLAFLPLVPPSISNRAYRFTLFGTAIGAMHSIYLQYGIPRSWNLQGIQYWLQPVVAGKELLYLMYSIIFILSYSPIKFAVLPLLCRSLELVARYLRQNFSNAQLYRKYLASLCTWVESNSGVLNTLSANWEVGIGFLLIFLVFTPQRNFLQIMLYWQVLKLKYKSPTSAAYHRSTWGRIGATVNPLVARHAPFLQRPLDLVKQWFLS